MSDKTAIEIDDNGTAFFIKFGGGGYLQRKERLSFTEPDLSVHEHAICELAAEVRRLRAESTDVFECADGTVAKDATVAAQTWADECRRLQAREAKAREILQAHHMTARRVTALASTLRSRTLTPAPMISLSN